MKTAGIIAEYNPFHNGHKYHINQTRLMTEADYVIVVMSGDFVQRGGPAILDKYTRAEMALRGGADLVIELPVIYASSSAEGFACGAVRLLNAAGVTDCISFGAEISSRRDKDMLYRAAKILLSEPETYKTSLLAFLKQGMSYPAARQKALESYLNADASANELSSGAMPEDITNIISSPNNILAAEYIKAVLKYCPDLKTFAVPRKGSSYHEDSLKGPVVSAEGIRIFLKNCSFQNADVYFSLSGKLSGKDLDLLIDAGTQKRLIYEDDFSDMLFYALSGYDTKHCFSDSAGLGDLSRRIINLREEYTGWSSFAAKVKTKNETLTGINRALTSILLGTDKILRGNPPGNIAAPYLRVLGFKKSAAPLLSELEKNSAVPVITKAAEGRRLLAGTAKDIFDLDIRAADIYNRAVYSKSGVMIKNDYRHPLVYL